MLSSTRASDFPNSPDRPLRIEMVLPCLDVGGMEMLALAMARSLTSRGHEVGITCIEREGELADAARADGLRVSVAPALGVRTLVRAPGLASHFARLRPDVVHTHNGAWEKGAGAARAAGVPVVGNTFHGINGGEPWYFPRLLNLGARRSDWVVPVSEHLRTFLHERARVPLAKLHVLINGVDTERFQPSAERRTLRARMGLDERHLVVAIVARLVPLKSHALLLDAFARVQHDVPNARLAIVGDGELRADLNARIDALGLRDRVQMLGSLRDLDTVYRDIDVFVLPSTMEGTSMSVLEAMASGACVVASAVGGTPNLLADGACGVLFPSGDVAALADGLRAVLRDRARREALAAAARARVVEHFSLDAMLDGYERLYRGAPAPRHHLSSSEIVSCAG